MHETVDGSQNGHENMVGKPLGHVGDSESNQGRKQEKRVESSQSSQKAGKLKLFQSRSELVVFLIPELSDKKIKGDDLLSQCLKVPQRISCYSTL